MLIDCLGKLGKRVTAADRKTLTEAYNTHRKTLPEYEASLEALKGFHKTLADELGELRAQAKLPDATAKPLAAKPAVAKPEVAKPAVKEPKPKAQKPLAEPEKPVTAPVEFKPENPVSDGTRIGSLETIKGMKRVRLRPPKDESVPLDGTTAYNDKWKPVEEKPEGYGSKNTGVKPEEAAKAKKQVLDAIKKGLKSDRGSWSWEKSSDDTRKAAVDLAAFHIEAIQHEIAAIRHKGDRYVKANVREFKDWAHRMLEDVGEHVRPHLRMLYKQGKAVVGATEKYGQNFLDVWHGTPHRFNAEVKVRDAKGNVQFLSGEGLQMPRINPGETVLEEYPLGRFREDKFLAGEGAAAYGAGGGGYHADRRGVASDYRDNRGDSLPQPIYKGKPFNRAWDGPRSEHLLADVFFHMQMGKSAKEAIDREIKNHEANHNVIEAAIRNHEHIADTATYPWSVVEKDGQYFVQAGHGSGAIPTVVDTKVEAEKIAKAKNDAHHKSDLMRQMRWLRENADDLHILKGLDPKDMRVEGGGTLYRTRIHASDQKLLHWDLGFKEQPSEVKKGLQSLSKELRAAAVNNEGTSGFGTFKPMTADDVTLAAIHPDGFRIELSNGFGKFYDRDDYSDLTREKAIQMAIKDSNEFQSQVRQGAEGIMADDVDSFIESDGHSAGSLYRRLADTMSGLQGLTSERAKLEVSRMLEDHGLKGVRFLDGASREQWANGDRRVSYKGKEIDVNKAYSDTSPHGDAVLSTLHNMASYHYDPAKAIQRTTEMYGDMVDHEISKAERLIKTLQNPDMARRWRAARIRAEGKAFAISRDTGPTYAEQKELAHTEKRLAALRAGDIDAVRQLVGGNDPALHPMEVVAAAKALDPKDFQVGRKAFDEYTFNRVAFNPKDVEVRFAWAQDNKVIRPEAIQKAAQLLSQGLQEASRTAFSGVPIDPKMLKALGTLVAGHVEAGVRKMADVAVKLKKELGEAMWKTLEPHLPKVWAEVSKNFPIQGQVDSGKVTPNERTDRTAKAELSPARGLQESERVRGGNGVLAKSSGKDSGTARSRPQASEARQRSDGQSGGPERPHSKSTLTYGRSAEDPTYGKPAEGAVSVKGVHFSRNEQLNLDSKFYGTGMKGAERNRVLTSKDPRLKQRLHFYYDTGKGIRPESNVGNVSHEIVLNNLYDMDADPKGLVRSIVHEWTGPRPDNVYAQLEAAVLDAGYDGYKTDTFNGQGAAVLLGEHRIPRYATQELPKDYPDASLTLKNQPKTATVNGVEVPVGASKPIVDTAREYMKSTGREYNPPTEYVKVDKAKAKRIADAYAEMKHDPDNPEVKRAYKALADETKAQFDAMQKAGIKVEFTDSRVDPYGNFRNGTLDLINNKHLYVFPTDLGFGSDPNFDPKGNPMLEPVDGVTFNGKPVLLNDIFRAVHDYYGHAQWGNGFREEGEENAWRSHRAMYSDDAAKAMTSETRGQASWVYNGPHGEANTDRPAPEMVFADQKVGLLPDWVTNDIGASASVEPTKEASSRLPATQSAEAMPRPSEWGSRNTKVTTAEAVKARQSISKELARTHSKLGAGLPDLSPELVKSLTKLAAYHIEAGAREFGDFSRRMVKDVGEAIRPLLRELYAKVRDEQGHALDKNIGKEPFYSPTEREIELNMPARASADQVRGLLKGAPKEELEWLDLDTYLNDHPKVDKDDLLDYVRANNAHVQEVTYKAGANSGEQILDTRIGLRANAASLGFRDTAALEQAAREGRPFSEAITALPHRPLGDGTKTWTPESLATYAGDERYRHLQEAYEEYAGAEKGTKETRYDNWKLPGGKNYRELLLTLPKRDDRLPAGWSVKPRQARQPVGTPRPWAIVNAEGREEVFGTTPEDAIANLHRSPIKYSKSEVYTSPHWAEPNVLAHVRFDDRDDGKTLHVAEFQSDWHQEGRKKGYKLTTPESVKLYDDINQKQAEADKLYGRRNGLWAKLKALREKTPRKVTIEWNGKELAKVDLDRSQGGESIMFQKPFFDALEKYGKTASPEKKEELFRDLGRVMADLHNVRFLPDEGYKVGTFNIKGEPLPEEELKLAKEFKAASRVAQDAQTKVDRLAKRRDSDVPDGPFKKSWPELAMKRMIRYAAENGYKRLTWDTGDTVADRFSLQHHVDSIVWEPWPDNQRNVAVRMKADDLNDMSLVVNDTGEVIDSGHSDLTGKNLSDIVGSEVASKILNDQGERLTGDKGPEQYTLAGDGLNVGGEGAKGFYDNMLPSKVNDYVKKWGGKVETGSVRAELRDRGEPVVEPRDGEFLVSFDRENGEIGRASFPTRAEAEEFAKTANAAEQVPVHSLDITPEMRQAAKEGQPLYGSQNKHVTTAQLKTAEAIISKKLRESTRTASSGLPVDPELAKALITVGAYHIEAGARKFADFSKKMLEDFGETVKPHLQAIYDQVKKQYHFDGMDGLAEKSAEKSVEKPVVAKGIVSKLADKAFTPTGEKKPSKIGKSIEAKAIEQGLVEGFDKTAEYDAKTVKDQAEKVSKLIADDPDRVSAIVRGTEDLPAGINPSMFIDGVERHADAIGGDEGLQLKYDLANSDVVTKTSEAAQTLRFTQEREQDSVTRMLQDIRKARMEKIQKTLKGRDIDDVIKEEAQKLAPTLTAAKKSARQKASKVETWRDFIQRLEC